MQNSIVYELRATGANETRRAIMAVGNTADRSTSQGVRGFRNLGRAANRTSGRVGQLNQNTNVMGRAMQRSSRYVRQLGGDLGNINRRMRQTNSLTASLHRSFLALTGGFGAGIGLGLFIRDFARFNDTMRLVQATAGATERQFRGLTDTAIQLGRTTRFNAQQAAEGMLFLAQAGLEVREIFSAIRPVLNFAIAAGLNLASAAEIATNNMTAFNISIEQASRVMDVLTLTAQSSNTNVSGLANALRIVGPIAGQFNVSFEETNAVLATLANNALKGSRAGTGFRGVLSSLAAPSRRAATELRLAGLALEDVDFTTRGLLPVLRSLNQAGLDSGQLFRIFGREAATAGSLMSRFAGDISTMASQLRGANGTVERTVDLMEQSLRGVLIRLQSAISGFGNTFVRFFEEPLKRSADLISDFVNSLSDAGPLIGVLAAGAGSYAAAALLTGGARGLIPGRRLGRQIGSATEQITGAIGGISAGGSGFAERFAAAQFALSPRRYGPGGLPFEVDASLRSESDRILGIRRPDTAQPSPRTPLVNPRSLARARRQATFLGRSINVLQTGFNRLGVTAASTGRAIGRLAQRLGRGFVGLIFGVIRRLLSPRALLAAGIGLSLFVGSRGTLRASDNESTRALGASAEVLSRTFENIGDRILEVLGFQGNNIAERIDSLKESTAGFLARSVDQLRAIHAGVVAGRQGAIGRLFGFDDPEFEERAQERLRRERGSLINRRGELVEQAGGRFLRYAQLVARRDALLAQGGGSLEDLPGEFSELSRIEEQIRVFRLENQQFIGLFDELYPEFRTLNQRLRDMDITLARYLQALDENRFGINVSDSNAGRFFNPGTIRLLQRRGDLPFDIPLTQRFTGTGEPVTQVRNIGGQNFRQNVFGTTATVSAEQEYDLIRAFDTLRNAISRLNVSRNPFDTGLGATSSNQEFEDLQYRVEEYRNVWRDINNDLNLQLTNLGRTEREIRRQNQLIEYTNDLRAEGIEYTGEEVMALERRITALDRLREGLQVANDVSGQFIGRITRHGGDLLRAFAEFGGARRGGAPQLHQLGEDLADILVDSFEDRLTQWINEELGRLFTRIGEAFARSGIGRFFGLDEFEANVNASRRNEETLGRFVRIHNAEITVTNGNVTFTNERGETFDAGRLPGFGANDRVSVDQDSGIITHRSANPEFQTALELAQGRINRAAATGAQYERLLDSLGSGSTSGPSVSRNPFDTQVGAVLSYGPRNIRRGTFFGNRVDSFAAANDEFSQSQNRFMELINRLGPGRSSSRIGNRLDNRLEDSLGFGGGGRFGHSQQFEDFVRGVIDGSSGGGAGISPGLLNDIENILSTQANVTVNNTITQNFYVYGDTGSAVQTGEASAGRIAEFTKKSIQNDNRLGAGATS